MNKLVGSCFGKQLEDERQISMEAILRKLNKRLKYDRSDVFVLLVRIYTRHLERKDLKEACFMIRELGRICEVENIDRYVSTILARDILVRDLNVGLGESLRDNLGDQTITVVKEKEGTLIENTGCQTKMEEEIEVQLQKMSLE